MAGTPAKTSRRTPSRARPAADPSPPVRAAGRQDVSDLRRRLGNRGVSVALRSQPDAPEGAPVPEPDPADKADVVDPQQKKDGEPAEETLSATDTRGDAEETTGEPQAEDAPATGGGPARRRGAEAPETGGEAATTEEESTVAPRSVEPETGAGDLSTGDLVLIDVELAEHQRWAGARGRVGEVASLQRAEFVVQAAGGGFVNGVASGAGMGLGMGLVTRYVPALGPILGAKLALHGLITNEAETSATIARFGEGNDTYDLLANSMAAAAAMIDTVSQMLTVINGIVGIVETAAAVITGGAVIAAFFTFGATLGVAVIAGDVVLACQEIATAINVVTTVLDNLNARILQPAIMLFRALHTFTTQADPREVEAQGQGISQAAGAAGAALGAAAGGKLAHAGAKPKPPPDDLPPANKPPHETPPPAPGDGPEVHFQEPAPAAKPQIATAGEQGPAAPAVPPAAEPVQLTLPHTEGPGSDLRPITAPLQLEGIKGSDAIPQGLEPGSIGTYARAVDDPHPAALASNPPGAPGATTGGGRMPQEGRKDAGVYLEHQTSAAAAHEVLPGHEYKGPEGQDRAGRDTKDALVIALPEAVKGSKDTMDRELLKEVRDRKGAGEAVPAIEVIARSTQITQDAIAQAGADVPGQQVSRNFLAEIDQFNDPRFGYQELRPGDPLPEGHPLASSDSAGLDAFLDRTFDPFITTPEGGGSAPPPASPLPAPPAGNPSQMSFDFGPGTSPTPPAPAPAPAPASALATPPPVPADAPSSPTTNPPTPGPGSSTLGLRAQQVGGLFLPALFGSGGEGPTYAERQAAHRARFTGDNQPAEGVERVDPNYPPPPATPAQITAIQNQILNLLAVRAAAEQEAQLQAERAAVCDENQSTIEQTVADTKEGIAAIRTHDEAVARRAAVNQEQQQRQHESQALVAGYPSQAAGLAVLTVPLAAWAGFTSLASHLPGSAGESMLQMNKEAEQLLEAFGHMAGRMAGAESSGPGNEQQLHDDRSRLADTAKSAERSDEKMHSANAGARNLQQANEAARAEAVARQETADARAQQCTDAATDREAHAELLAQQLRVWAARHAQARQQAVAATSKRLQKEGRIIMPEIRK